MLGYTVFLPAYRPSEFHWSDSTQRGSSVIPKTSEYLAKLQSHHYECHLSQLHRCADMPIKSMITLFFLAREHIAITVEQEKTACSRQFQVILKNTLSLTVTTLATKINMKFLEGQRRPLPSPSWTMADTVLEVEQTGKYLGKEWVSVSFHTERNLLQKTLKKRTK